MAALQIGRLSASFYWRIGITPGFGVSHTNYGIARHWGLRLWWSYVVVGLKSKSKKAELPAPRSAEEYKRRMRENQIF